VKADKKIYKLTGVVKANAAKSAKGRRMIRSLEDSNKQELEHAVRGAIEKGEKRRDRLHGFGDKMDKDTRWLVNNKITTEISKLRHETKASVEALALQSKSARAEMKKEMLYAIRSAADVAKQDLGVAISDGVRQMAAFQKKAAASHAKSAVARKVLAARIRTNAKGISRMLRDAVATVARANLSLHVETAKKIKKTNMRVSAYADRMRNEAAKARAQLKAVAAATMNKLNAHQAQQRKALSKFASKDAARQQAALKFSKAQIVRAEKETNAKFGKAFMHLAALRGRFDKMLGASAQGLNDALAKQAALADRRFSHEVNDLADARREAAAAVQDLRKEFATQMVAVTAQVKNTETRLISEISVVSGEVISNRANQIRVNRRVNAELKRIVRVSNKRFSSSKRARGRLGHLMNENKAAAAEELTAVAFNLKNQIEKARARNARNSLEMRKDLSKASTRLYERMAAMQKRNAKAAKATSMATQAAAMASNAALKRAKDRFAADMFSVVSVISANSKRAKKGMSHITGVVNNIARANKNDRRRIFDLINVAETDLNKGVNAAIELGIARGKAVEQRINEHLKNTKRYLQTELSEGINRSADNVFKIVNEKRQKVADNYLSLKAYSVAAADQVIDYRKSGKNGRNLSSIGDLLATIAALGAVKPPKAEGLGMGGKKLPTLFTAKTIKVSNAVAAINGLVNEYATSCSQVRARWPMGLGKYLLAKLEQSMLAKGVLQVDKVQGKAGNFVYINGRSVGLSNKLNDFSKLASRMSVYESVLAKLTAKLSAPKKVARPSEVQAKPPEWNGN